MSTEKQRWPRAEALQLAEFIVESLSPFCERIEIAGSLRRKKETVGDIEILFVPAIGGRPIPGDLFGATVETDLAAEHVNHWLDTGMLTKREGENGSTAWGAKNKLAMHSSGIPIDFFSVPAENWIVSLVIRTGGKDTNLKLTTGARDRGMTLEAYGAGCRCLETGDYFIPTTERELFEICGVRYAEPEFRD